MKKYIVGIACLAAVYYGYRAFIFLSNLFYLGVGIGIAALIVGSFFVESED